MAIPNDDLRSLDDPRLAFGEWLFKKGGQVFGPVGSKGLAEMLYRGEIEATTSVISADRRDESHWTPVAQVPLFVLHAKKAEALRKVEGEFRLEAKRGRRRLALFLVAAAALTALGVLAIRKQGGRTGSRWLEDFGEGIRVASPARVGLPRRVPGDEIAVTLDSTEPSKAKGPVRSSPNSGASMTQGKDTSRSSVHDDLVEARFDAKAIETGVSRQQRMLVPCFKAEVARSPDYRGRVPLEFAIGNDGRVSALWIDEPRFKEGTLKDCVWSAMATWRFDPFPGERPTVKLAFEVGG